MPPQSWTGIKELLKFLTPHTPKGVLTDQLCAAVALFLRSDGGGLAGLGATRGRSAGFTGCRFCFFRRLVSPELLQLSLISGFHGYSMTHLGAKDREDLPSG